MVNKMTWNKYEIYLDDSGEIPKAILKRGQSEIERAKMFFAQKEYDACANLLRKGLEKILKGYLTPQEQRDKNCNELDLAGLIGRATIKADGDTLEMLKKVDADRKHILNPLSHYDNRNTFTDELRSAIDDVEALKALLQ